MKPTENRQRQQKRGFLSTSQKAYRHKLYAKLEIDLFVTHTEEMSVFII